MSNKIYSYHTARRIVPYVQKKTTCANKGDIVTYIRKNKITKVGEGENDYVIDEIVVEESRVNRQAFIAKDASEVGVLNILEKVRRSGDVSLFNQTHQVIPEDLQDYVNVPHSVGSALNSLESGANSFEAIKALFPGKTFEDLANMSKEDISAAIQAYQNANKEV